MSQAMVAAETSMKSQRWGGKTLRLLRWAVWFGILAGILEILNQGFSRFVLGRYVSLNPYGVWLAPLADAALFLFLAAATLPLMLLWPSRVAERPALFVFGFALVASLVLHYEEIHTAATAILSGGAAVQITRIFERRLPGFDRLVLRTLPWMIAACAAMAAVLPACWAWWAWEERRDVAALPIASRASPNVLLVVWDTVRAKSLSTYGYDRDTSPNLTALGQEGVVFEQAVAPAPWTLPSHASFFTGHWAHELSSVGQTPLDDTYPTLAEMLQARGYLTAGFVANRYFCSRVHGLHRGFQHYEDFNVFATELMLSFQIGRRLTGSPRLRQVTGWFEAWERKSAERIDRDFLRWLDQRPGNRPFFAFLNYFDAHQPYCVPSSFGKRFRSREAVLPHCDVSPSASAAASESHAADRDAYDTNIAFLDECLGRLLGDLRKRGLLENTLVIVTSDHGEQFGEHGLVLHGNSLYRPLLHVPLVVRLPGGNPSGRQVSGFVSLRDLPATVMDLVGCENGLEVPGETLRRHWEAIGPKIAIDRTARACLRPTIERNQPDQRLDAVLAEGMHYIRYFDGREELYDFLADPDEANDLSLDATMRPILARFRARIAGQAGT